MIKFTDGCVSKIAIAVVIGGVSLACPVYAADTDTSTDTSASSADSQSGGMMKHEGGMMKHEGGMKRVDDRIKELHETLNITPDQEPQWRKLSHVMRQNEASVHKLVEARNEREGATAVEDLKSYEAITHAHEQGLKRLIPVFDKFYDSLSEDQRATADDMFSKYEGHQERKSGRANSPENMTPAAGGNWTPAPADNNVNTPNSNVNMPNNNVNVPNNTNNNYNNPTVQPK